MIIGIVAVDQHWGIGKNGGLLFNLKKDMKHFRESTTNNIVVMGENTLLSFPNSKPLKNRTNIVLCPEGHEYEGCICVHDFDKLISMLKCLYMLSDIFVIGGGMMYKFMLPYYDEVYVTKVEALDNEATVFFPNLDELENFKKVEISDKIEDNGYNIRFITYRSDNAKE